MEILNNIIPESSPIFTELSEVAETAKLVIFSGLPGVGKSLYINEFKLIAKSLERPVDLIQWDVARKAFETDAIMKDFPMGEGTVHNGLKLIAGTWLMDELKLWVEENQDNDTILLIEAPLVGNRFIELVQKNEDASFESFLASELTQVIMPIPSKTVRQKIEVERTRQVKEDAKVWSGAKPSVMLMLWKMTCGIANEFGMDIDMSGQPVYNPVIYEYVFSEILKHRHFLPLNVDEVFDIPGQDESVLHDTASLQADVETANHYAKMIKDNFSTEEIDKVVAAWYLT